MSDVAQTPALAGRHTARVAVQPVQLFGDPVPRARAAEVISEPGVKLSPHSLDKVR